MNTRVLTTSLVALAAIIALPLTAFTHHSVSAEFDGTKRIGLTGTITKVEWTNPHTFFYIDARDQKTGSVLKWACELGSPNMLIAQGWKLDTLKVGMTVTFTGILARDGSHKVIARNIVADGVPVSAWPRESR
jgi:uncharacterized protein DUF6152